jgi:hypothetical protein
MTPDPEAAPPLAAGQIEIWKKIVDVQQHFNDLELRIRNFALIVTGAFLGLGGYAIKDGGAINAFGHEVSIAGLVVFSAIFPMFAFYFMDRLWYHRRSTAPSRPALRRRPPSSTSVTRSIWVPRFQNIVHSHCG